MEASEARIVEVDEAAALSASMQAELQHRLAGQVEELEQVSMQLIAQLPCLLIGCLVRSISA